mmetsp:Transcript_124558/g.352610  ORF Transcript_124558/g.352610 Transcript_124558/m.352610 type:complete len:201 (-) Transcript_124558:1012-1614(-)
MTLALHSPHRPAASATSLSQTDASTFRLHPPRILKKLGASDDASFMFSGQWSHARLMIEETMPAPWSLNVSTFLPSRFDFHCAWTICRRVRMPPPVRRIVCKSSRQSPCTDDAFERTYSSFLSGMASDSGNVRSEVAPPFEASCCTRDTSFATKLSISGVAPAVAVATPGALLVGPLALLSATSASCVSSRRRPMSALPG